MSLLFTHTHAQISSSVYLFDLLQILHTFICVCVCVFMCRNVCVGVHVQQAGQYRGGGYPVTGPGKQYYSTGMFHMQCYSAAHTQKECVCDCSCASVHACKSAFFQGCVFV